jgi:hypothetical protein
VLRDELDESDAEGVHDAVPDSVAVADPVGEPEAVGVALAVDVLGADGVTDGDAPKERLAVGDAVREPVLELVGELVPVPDTVGVGVSDPDPVPELVARAVGDGV